MPEVLFRYFFLPLPEIWLMRRAEPTLNNLASIIALVSLRFSPSLLEELDCYCNPNALLPKAVDPGDMVLVIELLFGLVVLATKH